MVIARELTVKVIATFNDYNIYNVRFQPLKKKPSISPSTAYASIKSGLYCRREATSNQHTKKEPWLGQRN